MTCPNPDYCGVNGCTSEGCHPSRTIPVAARGYRPRGWARRHVRAALIVMAGTALLVAALRVAW